MSTCKPIANKLSFTKGKRKYVEEKTMTKLKQTDIDRQGLKPSLNSSQPPDPHFSLPTIFKEMVE
jgi:hypothetical protein